MKTEQLFGVLQEIGVSFYTGVPDSQLSSVCNYIETWYANQNWVVPNEGAAVATAAGHYLSTREIACVYMQNSGIGNAINPICSLTSPDVYAVPMVFLIGWRGEPGVKDEPQHVFQGKITGRQMDLLDIPSIIIDRSTREEQFKKTMLEFSEYLKTGKSIAVLVKKDGLDPVAPAVRGNPYLLEREKAIEEILRTAGDTDIIVSSTGKISREVFEIREKYGQGHGQDFLTVGSMGHCSAIALAIAKEKPGRRVICIDGDGALLMHMGTMAMVGSRQLKNFIHIVLDNEAHETVGGTPTISGGVDFCAIARACGYTDASDISCSEQIKPLITGKNNGSLFIRVRVALGSRKDLGRPTTTPLENKQNFMKFLED